MSLRELAEGFHRRFRGLERAHGRYQLNGAALNGTPGSKLTGRALTVSEPITVELWERHLIGEIGLGVTPITEVGTCDWGAIDVDDYATDHAALVRAIAERDLPLIVARSKSGGAHLYLFLERPAIARLTRVVLGRWVADLGLPATTEIFPKQDELTADGFGNWINVPYQGGTATTRYALDPTDGAPVDAARFLDLAAGRAISLEALRLVAETGAATEDEANLPLPGGPPCLNARWAAGITAEGHNRNALLFNLALYFHRVDPRHALELTLNANRAFQPPLGEAEARMTIRSALKKPYGYQCANPALAPVCDRPTCLARRYGIGSTAAPLVSLRNRDARPLTAIPFGTVRGPDDPPPEWPGADARRFGQLFKFPEDPPKWLLEVDGTRIIFESAQLLNQKQFIARVWEMTNRAPTPMRPQEFHRIIAELSLNARRYDSPDTATQTGFLWSIVENFCTGRAQGKELDELQLGKPVTRDGRTYFLIEDLLKACRQNGLTVTSHRVALLLRDRELRSGEMDLKGRRREVWSVPAFPLQTEPFSVPRDPDAGERF